MTFIENLLQNMNIKITKVIYDCLYMFGQVRLDFITVFMPRKIFNSMTNKFFFNGSRK